MGAALTREQTARYLYDAGFRGDDLTRMVAIAGRESGYDPAAHRTDQPKSALSGDMGLFQINYVNWPLVSKALGLTSKSQLFDPAVNAKAAKLLFDRGGYGPWTMGSNGWQAGGDPMKGTNYTAAKTATDSFLANMGRSAVMSDPNAPKVYQVGAAGFVQYPNGELQRLDPTGWAGLTSKYEPISMSQEDFTQLVKTSRVTNDLPAGNVSPALQSAWNERRAATSPSNPATGQPTSPEVTNLLKRFNVSYENAPPATPALLAFMRGLGLTQDTADDTRSTALARLGSSKTENETALARNADSQKKSLTGTLVRRGVLQSGESTTRYAEHEADVGERRSQIASAYGQGVENVESAYQNTSDSLRQQALERVLNSETDQAREAAASRAQTEALQAQTAAADMAWRRTQEAAEAANQWQVDFYRNNPGAA